MNKNKDKFVREIKSC